MMVFLALVAFQLNDEADSSVNRALSSHLEKIEISQELFVTASRRLQLLQSILLEKENILSAKDKQELEKLDQNYLRISEKLLPLLSANEGEVLLKSNRLNARISELHNQVTVLLENGGANEATQVLLQDV